ncbi:MAG: hypothetical protein M5U30_04540 [Burkholderiaceae bacterium]|nr:hypothetical protein [Burkholderiaceae bacterium]
MDALPVPLVGFARDQALALESTASVCDTVPRVMPKYSATAIGESL